MQFNSSINELLYYKRKPTLYEIKQIHIYQEELEHKPSKGEKLLALNLKF
jgi:hypothetical protein